MASGHGTIHWSELMTHDAPRAQAFFEKIAGWSINEWDMGDGQVYRVCMAGETPVAGIQQMQGPQFEGMPANWMTFIEVADVDGACATASAEGGQVETPPFDVDQVGRIAIVTDPTGARVGLITPAAAPA